MVRADARPPGRFYLWILEQLFIHNELTRGVLTVDGSKADLSAIDCPIFLLAGTQDHITPPEQVWALAHLVSTRAEQMRVPNAHRPPAQTAVFGQDAVVIRTADRSAPSNTSRRQRN